MPEATEETDASAASPAPNAVKTMPFEAEVSQVLHLVIHSLYSHKEVFLRELISNASDALDKLRFRALTEPDLMGGDGALEIRIKVDKDKGTLTLEDTGVGMTEEELTRELGTVARSGSKAFLKAIADKNGSGSEGKKPDVSLIGQFGVGFYSAYLVADRVDVVSRAAGQASAYRWSSDGQKSFTVEPTERAERGTSVTLHLKADQREFLEPWRLRQLVLRYSDYVAHPIRMPATAKDGKEGEAGELETVNRASALWQRPKSEITDEQYDEFYQHLTHDQEKPLARAHFKLEGSQELTGLLFIPRVPPFELGMSRESRGVRLFVKRVLIMDRCEELVPEWMRFVRGVVDSEDLPLNVSREVLQDSAASRAIKKQIVKATLDVLDRTAEDTPEDYATFWKAFGVMIKEGVAVDYEHKDRLAKLVRFASSYAPKEDESAAHAARGGLTSLHDYVTRMPLAQPAIYYVLGESRSAVESSPHLEELRRRGYEVLYMTDPVDEWAAEALHEFEGKKLVSAMRADLKLEETPEAKKEKEAKTAELGPLLARMKEALGDSVVDVKVSDRLTDSPACLVLSGAGPHGFVDRLLRERGHEAPKAKRVLEINAGHPVIEYLRGVVASGGASEKLNDWVTVLYDQALLTEGSALPDPNRFARLVTALLTEVAKSASVPA